MKLNVPDVLQGKRVLMVGIGGGYDVWGGLPLVQAWNDKQFILANYCRSSDKLYCSSAGSDSSEARLQKQTEGIVYQLPRAGVRVLEKALQTIVEKHNIDAVMAIDGGVDSLMHCDEEGAGTVIEDSVTLAAISTLPIKEKLLVCLGFGTELEEGVCHASVLENITDLAKQGAFFGTCSLTANMPEFAYYRKICEECWKGVGKSHVQTRVIGAVMGDPNLYEGVEANLVGGEKVEPHVSPLMSMYWFFQLDAVVRANKFIPEIMHTNTHTDVVVVYRQMIDILAKTKRERKVLPY